MEMGAWPSRATGQGSLPRGGLLGPRVPWSHQAVPVSGGEAACRQGSVEGRAWGASGKAREVPKVKGIERRCIIIIMNIHVGV